MSENKNNLVCISGVRGYEEDGVAYLHIEDSARGLGFTTTTEKGGVEYTNVRWSRVDECLQDLNFLPQVAENGKPHDYYIPENIFWNHLRIVTIQATFIISDKRGFFCARFRMKRLTDR